MRPLLSILLLVWLVLPGTAAGQPFSSAESVPHLRVHGEAELQVPADQLRLSVGVTTQAPDADAALARNSTRMRAVEQALHETGLDEKEYRTGHFSIQPRWSPRPRQAPPDWQPTISGFTVSNSFAVVTPKLKLAGPLIEAAVKAGANTVGDLVFDLADPQSARAEAIRQAMTAARTRARILAAAAGVPLGTVLAIALDQAAIRPQQLQAVRLETMAAGGEPPMAPGEVTVRAEVTMTYQLMPTAGP